MRCHLYSGHPDSCVIRWGNTYWRQAGDDWKCCGRLIEGKFHVEKGESEWLLKD
jgi:hypothetical protein